jgi:hypothetical protein
VAGSSRSVLSANPVRPVVPRMVKTPSKKELQQAHAEALQEAQRAAAAELKAEESLRATTQHSRLECQRLTREKESLQAELDGRVVTEARLRGIVANLEEALQVSGQVVSVRSVRKIGDYELRWPGCLPRPLPRVPL